MAKQKINAFKHVTIELYSPYGHSELKSKYTIKVNEVMFRTGMSFDGPLTTVIKAFEVLTKTILCNQSVSKVKYFWSFYDDSERMKSIKVDRILEKLKTEDEVIVTFKYFDNIDLAKIKVTKS